MYFLSTFVADLTDIYENNYSYYNVFASDLLLGGKGQGI